MAIYSDSEAALRGRFGESVLFEGDAGYDEARSVWNGVIDRHPAVIVRCSTTDEVVAALAYAREKRLAIAVRGGGHNVAGTAVNDGGIVIDLSPMRDVSVDLDRGTASAQGGATWGDVDRATTPHGFAVPGGVVSATGIAGLSLGGGYSHQRRRDGMTIDNLVSAEVVLADGSVVRASEHEHPDLFWGIRGGGSNFGIVTEFTYRLAPVDQILGGVLMLPASREVIRAYLDFVAAAPDDLTTIADLTHAPPAPFVPQERVGELVLSILVCWTGSMAEGERVLAPLRALATPVADAVSPIPYPDIYRFTAHQAEPHGVSIRSMFATSCATRRSTRRWRL